MTTDPAARERPGVPQKLLGLTLPLARTPIPIPGHQGVRQCSSSASVIDETQTNALDALGGGGRADPSMAETEHIPSARPTTSTTCTVR